MEATSGKSVDRVLPLITTASDLYAIGITFVKISALTCYNRIFGRVERFRWALIVTGVVCLVWFVISFVTGFFSCNPLHGGIAGVQAGHKCLSSYAVFVGTAAANVAIDVVILILPHFQLWRLQLGRHKKIGIAVIFLCGYS